GLSEHCRDDAEKVFDFLCLGDAGASPDAQKPALAPPQSTPSHFPPPECPLRTPTPPASYSLPGPELGYSGFCFLDSVCGHCPWGWAWFQRTCYYFSESTKIWREAKQFCLDYGAQLVIINTKEEQVFLVKNRPKSRAYWLGLSDKKVENQWLWVDGSPLKLSFWSSGEPNDSGDEDCGTMTLDGRWNDINCYMTDYWICEKPWLC
uniref:C-type lectin domain-containing protein n=1 Tax=Chrysemys picta bellii TaxID=8478 RepID=A0A8C3HCI9_CHRPI